MRNARYLGHFDDRPEAEQTANRHRPSVIEGDPEHGWDVYELKVRGDDGVTRDRRYASTWADDVLDPDCRCVADCPHEAPS